MRSEGAEFCHRLTAMNQRWPADGNLDGTERVQLTAGFDFFAGAYVLHLCDPRFVRWGPGRIKNNYARLAQPGRQRKLRIPNADLVRLEQPPSFKDIHSVSRRIHDNP